MLGSVFTKTIYDRRWAILGWGFGLAVLAWMVVVIYPSFGKNSSFATDISQLPPAFQKLAGNVSGMNTPDGFISSQLFQKSLPLAMAIFGIILGCGAIAGEEERGTLQTLLSAPISRGKVLMHKWLALIAVLTLSVAAMAAGLWLGAWQIHITLPTINTLLGLGNTLIFGIFFMTLSFSLGALSGRFGVAVGVSSAVAAAGYIFQSLAAMVESLKPFEKLSPFYYYGSKNVLAEGVTPLYIAALLLATAVLFLAGLMAFRKRDIRG